MTSHRATSLLVSLALAVVFPWLIGAYTTGIFLCLLLGLSDELSVILGFLGPVLLGATAARTFWLILYAEEES